MSRRGLRALRVLLATGGLLASVPALCCSPALTGDDVRRVEGASFVVAWRPDPAPLRLNEFFAIEVATCAKDAAAGMARELRVDAVMPEHKHGMNYAPTVTAAGNGRFRAEGWLLHMPGLWEFRFDVRAQERQERLADRATLR